MQCHTTPPVSKDSTNHESQNDVVEESKPDNLGQDLWEKIARAPEIQELLVKHPGLQKQLTRIYQTTKARQVGKEPAYRKRDEGSGMQGGNHVSRNMDSQDRRFRSGLNELTRQLETENAQSIPLARFCEKVDELLKRQ